MPENKQKHDLNTQVKPGATNQVNQIQGRDHLTAADLQQAMDRQKEALVERRQHIDTLRDARIEKLNANREDLAIELKRPEMQMLRTEDRDAAASALDRFQMVQQEQVQACRRQENNVLADQVMVAANSEYQQRSRIELVDKNRTLLQNEARLTPDAERALISTREKLEERYRNEITEMGTRFQEQNRELDIYQNRLDAQLKNDRRALIDALDRVPASGNSKSLETVLARQEAKRTELEAAIQGTLNEQQHKAVNRRTELVRYGDYEVYRWQLRAVWEGRERKSEHEHIRAYINQVLQTRDPQTQNSPVDRKAYRNEVTITIPRDMAIEKTRMDMELKRTLEEALQTGAVTEALQKQTRIEAAIERMIQARDHVIRARLEEGRAIDDLVAVTDSKIKEAANLQESEIFEVGKGQVYSMLHGADKEIEQMLDNYFDRWILDVYQNVEEAKRKLAEDIRLWIETEESRRRSSHEPDV